MAMARSAYADHGMVFFSVIYTDMYAVCSRHFCALVREQVKRLSTFSVVKPHFLTYCLEALCALLCCAVVAARTVFFFIQM